MEGVGEGNIEVHFTPSVGLLESLGGLPWPHTEFSEFPEPADADLNQGKETREERQVPIACLVEEVPTESNCRSGTLLPAGWTCCARHLKGTLLTSSSVGRCHSNIPPSSRPADSSLLLHVSVLVLSPIAATIHLDSYTECRPGSPRLTLPLWVNWKQLVGWRVCTIPEENRTCPANHYA